MAGDIIQNTHHPAQCRGKNPQLKIDDVLYARAKADFYEELGIGYDPALVVEVAMIVQALNEEQISMRKAAIQNRMTLDMLTAAQGGTCAIIKAECCVCLPDLSGNVSTALGGWVG